jgi:hypothetical protein
VFELPAQLSLGSAQLYGLEGLLDLTARLKDRPGGYADLYAHLTDLYNLTLHTINQTPEVQAVVQKGDRLGDPPADPKQAEQWQARIAALQKELIQVAAKVTITVELPPELHAGLTQGYQEVADSGDAYSSSVMRQFQDICGPKQKPVPKLIGAGP